MRPYHILLIFVVSLLPNSLFAQTISPKKSGKYTVSEYYKIYDHANPAELTVRTVCTGLEADYMRKTISSKGHDSIAKEYFKYYTKVYPGISARKPLVIQDQGKKTEVVLIEQYSIPEFFKRDSVTGAYDADLYSDVVNSVFPKLASHPKEPLYVGWDDVDHTIQLDMPGGWNIDMESAKIKNKAFVFLYDVQEADNLLTLHFQFKYLKDVIAIQDYNEFASQIEKIKEEYLDYPISHFPDSLPFYPNRVLIISCILLVIFFSVLAYLIYYRTHSAAIYRGEPLPLGGWLLIVVLGLLATVYNQVKTISDDKHMDLNTWHFYSARQSSTFFKVILGTKVFAEIYIICFALFCVFLMYKQRDILPKIITVYFATSAILMTILHILFTRLYGDHPDSINDLTYLVVSSFIGMYYFRTAERVKDTFVLRVKKN